MPSFKYLALVYDYQSLQDILTAFLNLEEVLLLMPKDLWEEESSLLHGMGKVIPLINYLNSAELETIAFRAFHQYSYQRIIATNELDILRAARLRTLLELPGQGYESALAFRKKTVMKRILQQRQIKGIPVFQSIQFPSDLFKFINKKTFPFIIKPDLGTGSEGIKIFHSSADIFSYLEETPHFQVNQPVDLQAEDYIDGQMYHINGFVLDGELINCWPCVYPSQSIEMTRGKSASSYLLHPSNPLVDRLIEYTKNILKAFPTPLHTAFHLEVFHTPQDEIIFCEIASRIGGKGVRQAWQESFGIPLGKLFVQTQAGLAVKRQSLQFSPLPLHLTGEIWFPTRPGLLTAIETSCPFAWVKDYQIFYQPGDIIYHKAKNITDCLGGVSLLIANTEEEMQTRLQLIEEWFQNSVKWSKV